MESIGRKTRNTLIAGLLIVGLAIWLTVFLSSQYTFARSEVKTPQSVQGACPDPSLWPAQIWSTQNGYGPASLCDGVKALEWATSARSPSMLIQTIRMFAGNYVDAQVQVTSVIRDTPPYTFTVALDDTAQPQDFGEVSFPCYYEVPSFVQNHVTGTIARVNCHALGSEDCYFYISADTINGRSCPIDTPTPDPEPTATATP